LREDKTAKVAVTSYIRDAIIELDMRIMGSGIRSEEYNRIKFFNVADRDWMHRTRFSQYHTIFFDEFAQMRYLEPMPNGYYVSSPGEYRKLEFLTGFTGGKYYKRKIACRLLKKEYKGKSKTNLSR
jgi:hypothetical protein